MSPTFPTVPPSRKVRAYLAAQRALTIQARKFESEARDIPSPSRWKRRRGRDMTVIESKAPGFISRARGHGVVYYWAANRTAAGKKAIKSGYTPKGCRLRGSLSEMESRCLILQAEVERWNGDDGGKGHAIAIARYSGTLGSLIKLYRAAEDSGYKNLKYNSKRTYDQFLDRLSEDHGKRNLWALSRRDFFLMHKKYSEGVVGHVALATAYRMMNQLRLVVRYGIGVDEHCKRLAEILSTMRFERGATRKQYLTADMVIAIRKQAHRMGLPRIALAQAIQFETALRQRDVIGEWWPNLPGRTNEDSLTTTQSETWVNGLVWGVHISDQLILAKPTSKSSGKKLAVADLNFCPMVLEELALIPIGERVGPVIITPRGYPYNDNTFRVKWRKVADAAGIPPDHCNMDSRAGAVTEGSEADVDIEHLRQFATHSEAAMTRHYNRATLVKARKVHVARANQREAAAPRPPGHYVVIDG